MSVEVDPKDTEEGGDTAAGVPPTMRRPGQSTVGLERGTSPEADLPLLAPGEQLAGRFTILRFVARGGMGAVYEATDVILRSRVALKVLEGRITADPAAMERFRREVLLARRVSHPNVCRVYELYEATTASGTPVSFLTMEFLDGETLATRLSREGRFTSSQALPLVQQMCEGLAAAHAEGVIHRDFKSSNVMLVPRAGESATGSTRVVITDFGVARALEERRGTEALTGGAGFLGTPEYMAPEQVTGGEISPATDVYALGVVLYQMVTGALPFTGDTPMAIAVRRIDTAPPRPDLAAPGLDPRWSRAILRCLDRDPRHRFQRAPDVAAALISGQRRARWPVVLGALAILAVALVLGMRLGRAPTPAQPVAHAQQPSIAVLPFVDMSPGHDQEYFSDGVAQEILNALAQVPELRVVARSSS
ncbi:MAG TPA: serine/threonine-protein kinase, partial [Myxococcaceae bacterium]|nr:serine/threonine-protein kinase [Myxococcaceae bacterium]